jgi:UDP-N-acetylglucosamine--N-acetylmuramyl-(pentapeptide) pyrophosphoryl-undecaprenol N-acetylglucosamine transferase
MRVVVTAGGTGGHIYPALAIIHKIKETYPDSEFLYIGTHNRMEKDIIPNYSIPFKSIEIYGLNRKNIFKNVKSVKCFLKALKDVKRYLKEFEPDVVIGCGGYVTGPVIYQASRMGYKTFIHEQNSIPGAANKFLSKYVSKIGVSFESSMQYFPKEKTVFTGNPCSEEAVLKEKISKEKYGISKEKKLVLFVMGSLGSVKMNNFLKTVFTLFEGKGYDVLFVTGKNYYDDFKDMKVPRNVHITPYVENMPGLMKDTTLMVSRAGASTLSEIIALNVPSILIPSPYVTNNHQYKNALDLVNQKAAFMIEEADLTKQKLVSSIDEALCDDTMKEMKTNLEKLKVDASASKIVSILDTLVRG